MKKTLFLVSLCALFVCSCSSVAHLQTDDYSTVTAQQTNEENIAVYSVDKIGKEYVVIGEVVASADAGTNSETPVRLLKREAAKLGADAIINLRLNVGMGYWSNAIKAEGTAVVYKK